MFGLITRNRSKNGNDSEQPTSHFSPSLIHALTHLSLIPFHSHTPWESLPLPQWNMSGNQLSPFCSCPVSWKKKKNYTLEMFKNKIAFTHRTFKIVLSYFKKRFSCWTSSQDSPVICLWCFRFSCFVFILLLLSWLFGIIFCWVLFRSIFLLLLFKS